MAIGKVERLEPIGATVVRTPSGRSSRKRVKPTEREARTGRREAAAQVLPSPPRAFSELSYAVAP
jgi:hypothetical protein